MKHLLYSLLLTILALGNIDLLIAQWEQTSGPYGGTVYSLAVSGTNLYAGTIPGVFLSTNNGASWTAASTGMTDIRVNVLAVSGTYLFAGTNGGIYVSANNGTGWTAASTGLTGYVLSLAVSGANLFAGTNANGVYLSTNNGTSWSAARTGLTNFTVNALAVSPASGGSGTNLFAGTEGGVFLSTNNGTNWSAARTDLSNSSVNAFAVSGTNLFVGTDGGVFLSTNNGTNWIAVRTGLTDTVVHCLAVFPAGGGSGTYLFAGTSGGIFLSTNNGTSWTAVNTGLTNTDVWSLAVSGANLFAGTLNGGVWRRSLSDIITQVAQSANELPSEFHLLQNYPNPFNASTVIEYVVPREESVILTVFNSLGQAVEVLVNERKHAGQFRFIYDAGALRSGAYFYRLQSESFVETRKFLLLR